MSPTVVALIPARGGSQRVPGKNVLPLAGHPLLAWSIASARESGIFARVVVSTDSEEIAEVARRYGADVPGLRPAELASATSPDVEWVLHAMQGRDEDAFALLRPTSPFRTAATIRRAWARFLELGERVDSLRAVELASAPLSVTLSRIAPTSPFAIGVIRRAEIAYDAELVFGVRSPATSLARRSERSSSSGIDDEPE